MSNLRSALKAQKTILQDAKADFEAERKELKRIEVIRDDLTAQITALDTKASTIARDNAKARLSGGLTFEGAHLTENKLSSLRREAGELEKHIEKQKEI